MSKVIFDILHGTGSAYATAKGYQAPPFIPGELIERKSRHKAGSFNKSPEIDRPTQSITGAPLRKFKKGVWYFMPVSFESNGKKWEFNDAVVSIAAKKTIIETPLVGRKGTVKELISIDDYEIKLVVVVSGDDYPEQEIQQVVRLWEINESIKMNCAVTDYFLQEDDRVVVKNFDFPAMEGNEDTQVITMTLLSDKNFELEIK
jgi:hypothetical protein